MTFQFNELRSIVVAVANLVLYPITKRLGRPKKRQDTSLPIILLLHGYLHNESAWRSFEKELEHHQIGDVYKITKRKLFSSIDDYAAQIHDTLENIQRLTPKRKVILIGHSMGGLAAMHYINKYEPSENHEILAVITLASPLHGTRIAKRGIGACAREMEPYSYFIEELLEKTELQKSIRYYHLACSKDRVVYEKFALREGAFNTTNWIAEGLGHKAPLRNKEVLKQIISWIRESVSKQEQEPDNEMGK